MSQIEVVSLSDDSPDKKLYRSKEANRYERAVLRIALD